MYVTYFCSVNQVQEYVNITIIGPCTFEDFTTVHYVLVFITLEFWQR